MRIAPIALYTIKETMEEMIKSSVLATCITHTHYLGVMGGLLQAYAIRQALESNIEEYKTDPSSFLLKFLESTIQFMELVEIDFINILLDCKEKNRNKATKNIDVHLDLLIEYFKKQTKNKSFSIDKNAYSNLLKKLKSLLIDCQQNAATFSKKEFHNSFAKCDVTALESIPVALFSFLIAMNPKCENEVNRSLKIENSFKDYDNFERVILYSISFGGDTDTIASMAGAIYGAFSNEENSLLLNNIKKICEGSSETEILGDDLYELVYSNQ
jgi:poly(ADP-ribose) glycohydrolase ARH3